MPEQTLRYRAELDLSGLQAQMAFARQEIGYGLQQAFAAPAERFGGFQSAYNLASRDVSAVMAFAPPPPQRFGGLMEPAFAAAEQSNFVSSFFMQPRFVTGNFPLFAPPPGVFAGEFFAAEREMRGQQFGLGALGAASLAAQVGAWEIGGWALGGVTARGMGAVGLGGLGRAAVPLLGGTVGGLAAGLGVGAAVGMATEAVVEDVRERMTVENMLRAQAPGLTGRGREAATARIFERAATDIELGRGEVLGILEQAGARGMFAQARSAEDMTQRFNQLVDNVKLFTKAFATSQEQALAFVADLERMGIQGGAAQDVAMRFRGIAQVAGMAPTQAFAAAAPVAEAMRQMGIDPQVGLQLAGTNLGIVGQFQQRVFGADIAQSERDRLMRQFGRDITVIGGPEQAAAQVSMVQATALRRNLGMAAMLAAVDPTTQRVDPAEFARLVREGDPQQIFAQSLERRIALDQAQPGRARDVMIRLQRGELQEPVLRQFAEDPETFRQLVETQARLMAPGLRPGAAIPEETLRRSLEEFGATTTEIQNILMRWGEATEAHGRMMAADVQNKERLAEDERRRSEALTTLIGQAAGRFGAAVGESARSFAGEMGRGATALNEALGRAAARRDVTLGDVLTGDPRAWSDRPDIDPGLTRAERIRNLLRLPEDITGGEVAGALGKLTGPVPEIIREAVSLDEQGRPVNIGRLADIAGALGVTLPPEVDPFVWGREAAAGIVREEAKNIRAQNENARRADSRQQEQERQSQRQRQLQAGGVEFGGTIIPRRFLDPFVSDLDDWITPEEIPTLIASLEHAGLPTYRQWLQDLPSAFVAPEAIAEALNRQIAEKRQRQREIDAADTAAHVAARTAESGAAATASVSSQHLDEFMAALRENREAQRNTAGMAEKALEKTGS